MMVRAIHLHHAMEVGKVGDLVARRVVTMVKQQESLMLNKLPKKVAKPVRMTTASLKIKHATPT
jgi:hypothetical protein